MGRRTLVRSLGTSVIGLIAVLGVCYWLKRPEHVFLPSLAQGLPAEFEKANETFKARINENFPVGSSESVLVRRLHEDGFKQGGPFRENPGKPEMYSASFVQPGFPCKLVWAIYWHAENDKLTLVTSSYTGTCL
ncbi:hypothetical protein [Methylobacterium sp. yr668]|uniref:hypothetical protein n=1 Tax=Methylobacterium sp. yr668 TaxID=1761801 RepID=UPI001114E9F0|nr:hypothetical protein [Methylobacterium sp. yr668]